MSGAITSLMIIDGNKPAHAILERKDLILGPQWSPDSRRIVVGVGGFTSFPDIAAAAKSSSIASMEERRRRFSMPTAPDFTSRAAGNFGMSESAMVTKRRIVARSRVRNIVLDTCAADFAERAPLPSCANF